MARPGRVAAIVVVALLALAAGVYLRLGTLSGLPDQSAVPALTAAPFRDLDGKNRRLDEWPQKVLVVNFWATWCPPCREEIPGLIRSQAKFEANGVQVVGIAVDSTAKVREYAQSTPFNYPILLAGPEAFELVRRLGNNAGGLPFTIVLDRKGNLVASHLGLLSEAELDRLIRPHLS